MKYDISYFLSKFELINEYLIGEGNLENHCALWHCGVQEYTNPITGTKNHTDESRSLCEILSYHKLNDGLEHNDFANVYYLNDGSSKRSTLGSTPKERIINALKEVKELHPEL